MRNYQQLPEELVELLRRRKRKKGKAGAVTKEAKPKPKWNSDLHDMSVYKLSERELKRRQEMYSPKPRPGLLEHVLQRSSSLERIKTSSTFDSSKEFKDVKHSSPEVESRQLHSSPAKSKQDGPPMSMPPFVTSPATTNEQATLSSDEKVKRKSQHLSPSNSLARRATSAPRVASKQHSAPSQQKVQKQSDIKRETKRYF
ncbi:uncharacterized protein MONOS_18490 [Monocercomonoides exilis]|uniref:uncharacterized protein n=1 Tax=Monocercomonoides exilis TaxID=2049356 RepID=UPI00355AA4DE|nr:hypothetical protein MONOS_18490 [Monocercomonoides exilis]